MNTQKKKFEMNEICKLHNIRLIFLLLSMLIGFFLIV